MHGRHAQKRDVPMKPTNVKPSERRTPAAAQVGGRKSERGAVIITVALFLMLLLGFLALGVEIGRWYLVRAELSKSVDAGALEGARNITNPYVDPKTVAQDFCDANFPSSYLGTPGSGGGQIGFNIQMPGNSKVQVDGNTSAKSIFAQVLGFDLVPVASEGVAQKKPVELMLVLDHSGSMSGKPIADLKVASKSFLDFFAPTQATDRAGLVSFSSTVKTDRAINTNFVAPMKTAIDAMNAGGWTNTSAAFAQTLAPGGFKDQTGVPNDARVQQFMVFFSDGLPTAFTGSFRRKGAVFSAIGVVTGNCVPGDNGTMNGSLLDAVTGSSNGIDPRITGDGMGASPCKLNSNSVHWMIFDQVPVPGHGPNDNCISASELHAYTCNLVRQMAIDNATALKNRGVVVYCIGLGPGVDDVLMKQLASGDDKYFHAPTSAELQAVFQQVAQQIQLRLVQ